MNREELSKLLVWSYQEGYKSAMLIIEHIASDRTQDGKFSEDMERRMTEVLADKFK